MSDKKVTAHYYSQIGGFRFKMLFDIRHLSHSQLIECLHQLWAGLTSICVATTRNGNQYILEYLPEIKWLYSLITSDLSEAQLLDKVDFHRKGVFEFKVRSEDLMPVMTSICEVTAKEDGTLAYTFHDIDKLVTRRWFVAQLERVISMLDFKNLKLTDNSYFEREESVIRSFQSKYEGELD